MRCAVVNSALLGQCDCYKKAEVSAFHDVGCFYFENVGYIQLVQKEQQYFNP